MLHLFYFQLAALYKAWNEVKKNKKKKTNMQTSEIVY